MSNRLFDVKLMDHAIFIPANVAFLSPSALLVDYKQKHNFSQEVQFVAYSDVFLDMLGHSPKITTISEKQYAFAHEAGIYDRNTDSVYFTANYGESRNPLRIHAVNVTTLELTDVTERTSMVMNGNGGCQYQNCLLFCAQGSMDVPSSLVQIDTKSWKQTTLIDNLNGREFNSINDVVIHHETGDIWFTDPTYGLAQGFKAAPDQPNATYRFDSSTQTISMVENSLEMPNGLCFSPDYKVMYITDTSAYNDHDNTKTLTWSNLGQATIYSFDVCENRLFNKSVFARVSHGVPDGIKCDTKGNVYTGCGDGVHVYSPDAKLLGKILIDGGVANFCFAQGKIWILNERKLMMAEIKARGCLETLECH